MPQIDLPTPLLLVLGCLVLVALAAPILRSLSPRSVELPYAKRKSLFSPAELRFLKSLELAVDDSIRIHGKVRLEDVISVTGVSGKRREAARGRIKSRHVDFVICDRETSQILAGVELDDRSHRKPKAKQVDAFKDRCFESAGLPLIRFQAAASYSADLLRSELQRSLIGDQPTEGAGVSEVRNGRADLIGLR